MKSSFYPRRQTTGKQQSKSKAAKSKKKTSAATPARTVTTSKKTLAQSTNLHTRPTAPTLTPTQTPILTSIRRPSLVQFSTSILADDGDSSDNNDMGFAGGWADLRELENDQFAQKLTVKRTPDLSLTNQKHSHHDQPPQLSLTQHDAHDRKRLQEESYSRRVQASRESKLFQHGYFIQSSQPHVTITHAQPPEEPPPATVNSSLKPQGMSITPGTSNPDQPFIPYEQYPRVPLFSFSKFNNGLVSPFLLPSLSAHPALAPDIIARHRKLKREYDMVTLDSKTKGKKWVKETERRTWNDLVALQFVFHQLALDLPNGSNNVQDLINLETAEVLNGLPRSSRPFPQPSLDIVKHAHNDPTRTKNDQNNNDSRPHNEFTHNATNSPTRIDQQQEEQTDPDLYLDTYGIASTITSPSALNRHTKELRRDNDRLRGEQSRYNPYNLPNPILEEMKPIFSIQKSGELEIAHTPEQLHAQFLSLLPDTEQFKIPNNLFDISTILTSLLHQNKIILSRQQIASIYISIIQKSFPDAHGTLYGSIATGLASPDCDCDISLGGLTPLSPLNTPDMITSPARLNTLLKELDRGLPPLSWDQNKLYKQFETDHDTSTDRFLIEHSQQEHLEALVRYQKTEHNLSTQMANTIKLQIESASGLKNGDGGESTGTNQENGENGHIKTKFHHLLAQFGQYPNRLSSLIELFSNTNDKQHRERQRNIENELKLKQNMLNQEEAGLSINNQDDFETNEIKPTLPPPSRAITKNMPSWAGEEVIQANNLKPLELDYGGLDGNYSAALFQLQTIIHDTLNTEYSTNIDESIVVKDRSRLFHRDIPEFRALSQDTIDSSNYSQQNRLHTVLDKSTSLINLHYLTPTQKQVLRRNQIWAYSYYSSRKTNYLSLPPPTIDYYPDDYDESTELNNKTIGTGDTLAKIMMKKKATDKKKHKKFEFGEIGDQFSDDNSDLDQNEQGTTKSQSTSAEFDGLIKQISHPHITVTTQFQDETSFQPLRGEDGRKRTPKPHRAKTHLLSNVQPQGIDGLYSVSLQPLPLSPYRFYHRKQLLQSSLDDNQNPKKSSKSLRKPITLSLPLPFYLNYSHPRDLEPIRHQTLSKYQYQLQTLMENFGFDTNGTLPASRMRIPLLKLTYPSHSPTKIPDGDNPDQKNRFLRKFLTKPPLTKSPHIHMTSVQDYNASIYRTWFSSFDTLSKTQKGLKKLQNYQNRYKSLKKGSQEGPDASSRLSLVGRELFPLVSTHSSTINPSPNNTANNSNTDDLPDIELDLTTSHPLGFSPSSRVLPAALQAKYKITTKHRNPSDNNNIPVLDQIHPRLNPFLSSSIPISPLVNPDVHHPLSTASPEWDFTDGNGILIDRNPQSQYFYFDSNISPQLFWDGATISPNNISPAIDSKSRTHVITNASSQRGHNNPTESLPASAPHQYFSLPALSTSFLEQPLWLAIKFVTFCLLVKEHGVAQSSALTLSGLGDYDSMQILRKWLQTVNDDDIGRSGKNNKNKRDQSGKSIFDNYQEQIYTDPLLAVQQDIINFPIKGGDNTDNTTPNNDDHQIAKKKDKNGDVYYVSPALLVANDSLNSTSKSIIHEPALITIPEVESLPNAINLIPKMFAHQIASHVYKHYDDIKNLEDAYSTLSQQQNKTGKLDSNSIRRFEGLVDGETPDQSQNNDPNHKRQSKLLDSSSSLLGKGPTIQDLELAKDIQQDHLEDKLISNIKDTVDVISKQLNNYTFDPFELQDEIESDLCLQNNLGVVNSALIREYLAIDPRVQPLILMVKEWAKSVNLHGASKEKLSSYAFTLLAIFYLQQVDIIPSLQRYFTVAEGNQQKKEQEEQVLRQFQPQPGLANPDQQTAIGHPPGVKSYTTHGTDAPMIFNGDGTPIQQKTGPLGLGSDQENPHQNPQDQPNSNTVQWIYQNRYNGFALADEFIGYGLRTEELRKKSIMDLFTGFLDYYANFDFMNNVISIQHGAPISKEYKNLYGWPSVHQNRLTRVTYKNQYRTPTFNQKNDSRPPDIMIAPTPLQYRVLNDLRYDLYDPDNYNFEELWTRDNIALRHNKKRQGMIDGENQDQNPSEKSIPLPKHNDRIDNNDDKSKPDQNTILAQQTKAFSQLRAVSDDYYFDFSVLNLPVDNALDSSPFIKPPKLSILQIQQQQFDDFLRWNPIADKLKNEFSHRFKHGITSDSVRRLASYPNNSYTFNPSMLTAQQSKVYLTDEGQLRVGAYGRERLTHPLGLIPADREFRITTATLTQGLPAYRTSEQIPIPDGYLYKEDNYFKHTSKHFGRNKTSFNDHFGNPQLNVQIRDIHSTAPLNPWSFLSIEDPLDLSHDLSRQCSMTYAPLFTSQCAHSYDFFRSPQFSNRFRRFQSDIHLFDTQLQSTSKQLEHNFNHHQDEINNNYRTIVQEIDQDRDINGSNRDEVIEAINTKVKKIVNSKLYTNLIDTSYFSTLEPLISFEISQKGHNITDKSNTDSQNSKNDQANNDDTWLDSFAIPSVQKALLAVMNSFPSLSSSATNPMFDTFTRGRVGGKYYTPFPDANVVDWHEPLEHSRASLETSSAEFSWGGPDHLPQFMPAPAPPTMQQRAQRQQQIQQDQQQQARERAQRQARDNSYQALFPHLDSTLAQLKLGEDKKEQEKAAGKQPEDQIAPSHVIKPEHHVGSEIKSVREKQEPLSPLQKEPKRKKLAQMQAERDSQPSANQKRSNFVVDLPIPPGASVRRSPPPPGSISTPPPRKGERAEDPPIENQHRKQNQRGNITFSEKSNYLPAYTPATTYPPPIQSGRVKSRKGSVDLSQSSPLPPPPPPSTTPEPSNRKESPPLRQLLEWRDTMSSQRFEEARIEKQRAQNGIEQGNATAKVNKKSSKSKSIGPDMAEEMIKYFLSQLTDPNRKNNAATIMTPFSDNTQTVKPLDGGKVKGQQTKEKSKQQKETVKSLYPIRSRDEYHESIQGLPPFAHTFEPPGRNVAVPTATTNDGQTINPEKDGKSKRRRH